MTKSFTLLLTIFGILTFGGGDTFAQRGGFQEASMNQLIRELVGEVKALRTEVTDLKREIQIVDNELHTLENQLARGGGHGRGGAGYSPRWHSCPTPEGLFNLKKSGTHSRPLPNSVPPHANEILVSVFWQNSKGPDKIYNIMVETRERGEKYSQMMTVRPSTYNAGYSYASTSFWLPVTSERCIYTVLPMAMQSGNFTAHMLGWR